MDEYIQFWKVEWRPKYFHNLLKMCGMAEGRVNNYFLLKVSESQLGLTWGTRDTFISPRSCVPTLTLIYTPKIILRPVSSGFSIVLKECYM